MSSSVGKDISRSICVNSNWRSARRSSSRKQRAIWKYRSKPEIISICLKSWGDWGSAYHWPRCTREGTRKSRAPSGVERVSIGVSTSRNPRSWSTLRTRKAISSRSTKFFCITGRRRSR